MTCSTVTVTKCKAALRTLIAFQFFQPTCLCKEPRADPECNTYRNLVFDHPCFGVKQLGKAKMATVRWQLNLHYPQASKGAYCRIIFHSTC